MQRGIDRKELRVRTETVDFQSRAKRAGSDGDMPAMNSLSVLGGTTEAR